MQVKTTLDYTVLALRVALGLWFFLLGAEKIFRVGMPTFARQVAEFRILMDPWNLVVAYGIAWVELVAGLCLLAGWLRRGASRALTALTLIFIFGNAQAMMLGFVPDCGCFGEWFTLSPGAKMGLLFLQLALLALVIVTERIGYRKVFAGSQLRLPR
jgi:uncharacterized membrane protein YphA (DoxX/SURF4 family)